MPSFSDPSLQTARLDLRPPQPPTVDGALFALDSGLCQRERWTVAGEKSVSLSCGLPADERKARG